MRESFQKEGTGKTWAPKKGSNLMVKSKVSNRCRLLERFKIHVAKNLGSPKVRNSQEPSWS